MKASILLDLFPVPKFLAMKTAGLSFSDDRVQFVKFKSSKHGLSVDFYGEKPIPAGVIVGGFVEKPDVLTGIVASIQKEHKLDLVEASLPEEKSYPFKAEVPRVNPKDLRSSVEFVIPDNVPFKTSEVVFDFAVLGDGKAENHLSVVVSVLPEKVVDIYTEVLHKAGILPVSFEVDSQAVAKSVVKVGDKKTYLVVNIMKKKIGFYIVEGGLVHFSSTIGTDDFPEIPMTTMVKDDSSVTELKDEKITIPLQQLLRETKKIITYWNTHKEAKSGILIEEILVCGRDGATAETADFLANNLELPVEVANVWANVFSLDEQIPDIPKAEALQYAAAIGLALP